MKNVLLLPFIFLLYLTAINAQTDFRLSNDSAVSTTSYNSQRCIAATGDTVHAVWSDFRGMKGEVYYTHSFDGGLTWAAEVAITSDNNYKSFLPAIGIDESDIYVIWMDSANGSYEIYYCKSSDAGNTWGAETRLTSSSASASTPSVYVSGLNINVTWYDNRDGNDEIYFKRSTDGGLAWSNDIRLTNALQRSTHPTITGNNNYLHVSWLDNRDGLPEIYYKRSLDGGINWEADVRITNDSAYRYYPSITCSDSVIHLVWEDYRLGTQAKLFYKKSTDNGLTWSADSNIVNSTSWSINPVIDSKNSQVYITWYDFRDFDQEIYFKSSNDGGENWGADTRLTCSSGNSRSPFIANSDPNRWHIIWEDLRDGNFEIYYKEAVASCLSTEVDPLPNVQSSFTFSVYPNPVANKLIINTRSDIETSSYQLNIYDPIGRSIYNSILPDISDPITLNNLESGIYFIRLTGFSNNGEIHSATHKIYLDQ